MLELRYAAVGFKRIDIAIRNDNMVPLDNMSSLYDIHIYFPSQY